MLASLNVSISSLARDPGTLSNCSSGFFCDQGDSVIEEMQDTNTTLTEGMFGDMFAESDYDHLASLVSIASLGPFVDNSLDIENQENETENVEDPREEIIQSKDVEMPESESAGGILERIARFFAPASVILPSRFQPSEPSETEMSLMEIKNTRFPSLAGIRNFSDLIRFSQPDDLL